MSLWHSWRLWQTGTRNLAHSKCWILKGCRDRTGPLDFPSTLVVPARVVESKLVAELDSEQHAEGISAALQPIL